MLIGHANTDQHWSEVVRGEAISRPLGEETNAHTNESAHAIARGCNQFLPFALRDGLLQGNGFLDFSEFKTDNVVIRVSVTVKSSKNRAGFFVAAFTNQPTGRFWHESNSSNLEQGWQSL